MKKMRLWLLLLAGCLMAGNAEARKTVVKVKQPGTLAQLVGEENKYRITDLTIRGAINNDDIRFLRDMCGQNAGLTATPGKVRSVNLHDVTFVPGGEPFLTGQDKFRAYVTSTYTMPDCMFYQCPVEQLVLPARVDTVGHWALAGMGLRSLRLPEKTFIYSNILSDDSLLTELTLPVLSWTDQSVSRLLDGLTSLRKLTFHDVDYVSGGTFHDMPALEELTFSGMVGHMDGYCVSRMPRLRTIRFGGTVVSTGGSQFVADCPELENVFIDGNVFCLGYGEAVKCPKFKGYVVKGCVVESMNEDVIPVTPPSSYGKAADWAVALGEAENWMLRVKDQTKFFSSLLKYRIPVVAQVARAVGDMPLCTRLEIMQNAGKDFPELSKLDILKLSARYVRGGQRDTLFSYAPASDSLLSRTREYFNLDSIAGTGDDISRIKNILYWLHDNVRHDGSSSWPDCRFNAVDLYEVCKRENRGLNCRFMAIMLNEMLLAEGIPARYLTCQSRDYDSDPDCHVINVAWSTSLGKWIWVDPTFAAYVTDENGLLLHPGEVRARLRAGLPLVLNEDANWNHENRQTVEDYLENYMAKNLYVISANTMNQAEPEGKCDHPQGRRVSLVPENFKYGGDIITSDDEYFWQPPVGTDAR